MSIDPNRLVDVSGLAYGVCVKGRVPIEFENYLWNISRYCHHPGRILGISYRRIRRMPELDEFWIGTQSGTQAKSRFSLFKQVGGFGLKVCCQGRGLFRISTKTIEIEWLPRGTGAAHYFFSHALPLWLEFQGIPVLHASAVSDRGKALAFLGRSGVGKSTLCVNLVSSGFEFLTDDGLALEEDPDGHWQCHPGPPLYRLWPSALPANKVVAIDSLRRVHSPFDKRMVPLSKTNTMQTTFATAELAGVYVLERQADPKCEVVLESIGPSESLVRLVEYSLACAPVDALALTVPRLKKLSRIVRAVGVKHLVFPSGRNTVELIKAELKRELENDSN